MWLEDDDPNDSQQVSDDIVDVVFKMDCRSLPIDHAESLYLAINKILKPELKTLAIHQIHVAESSNGWNRPQAQDAILMPSKRTRLVIRVAKDNLEHVRNLTGKTIGVGGHSMEIGPSSTRLLTSLTTLFARYVETSESEEDDRFIQRYADLLQSRDLQFKKMMSGRLVFHKINDQMIATRKLMIAGFSVLDSIKLQQQGIGDKQHYGLGIFMPHKGIDPVNGG